MSKAEPVETIHVYIVKEAEAKPVVDSSLHDTAKTATQPLVSQAQSTRGQLVPYLLIAVHLLIVLFALFAQLYLTLTETATITILPKSYHLSAQLTLANVESRIFQPVTFTQSKTVPATGRAHQDATAAAGTITLYNAATQEQTIDAGTLLIGSDGAHIVTDQTAYIPGATPPIEGQVTVSAHAVNNGAAGNISAGDIHGACCRENMFAYNSAFSGGQDARDYTMVTRQDIHSVVSSVLPILTQRIQTSLQEQLRVGEILTPHQCSQNIVTDRNVGEEASNVTATISESCRAGAYNQHSLQMQVTNAFLQTALTHVGTGYVLAHAVQPTITNVLLKEGTLHFSVLCRGDVIYHFSSRELTTLSQQLAGKSSQQAGAILSHLNGVDHLTVQMEKNGRFPTDPTHIHILFLLVS